MRILISLILNRLMVSLSFVLCLLIVAGCTKTFSIPDDYHKYNLTVSNEKSDEFEQFADIQTRFPEIQDENTTVVVALSGGGLRAANFSMGSLLALEKIPFGKSNLLKQVDYISSVSGGGLAAGAYVAGLLSSDCKSRSDFNLTNYLSDNDHVMSNLRAGFLGGGNFLKLLNPKIWFSTLDRGDALQDTISRKMFTLSNEIDDCGQNIASSREIKLGHIFVPAGKSKKAMPTTPYLIANSTNRTNGEIVSFTPAHLENSGITCYTHRMKKYPIDAGYYHELPLAVGIRSSASFPVGIVPATYDVERSKVDAEREYCKSINSKRDWQHIHLTDGGASDNLGVNAALEILNFEHRKWLQKTDADSRKKNPHTFLLVIVDAYNGNSQATVSREAGPNIFVDFYKSTNLPLSSFRILTKSTLSSLSQNKLSVIDAISGKTDINVAYIHMDDLNKKNRSVGTMLPTTFGLNLEAQNNLLISGMLTTLDVFGVEKGEQLTSGLTSDLGISVDKVLNENFISKANTEKIIRFDKFKRNNHRTESVEGVGQDIQSLLTSLDSLSESLAEYLYENMKYESNRDKSQELNQINKEYTDSVAEAMVVYEGVPVDESMTRFLLRETEKGLKRVIEFQTDLQDETELEAEIVSELTEAVNQHHTNLVALQNYTRSMLSRVPKREFEKVIELSNSLDAENNEIEARFGNAGIKTFSPSEGNFYFDDPEYGVGAQSFEASHTQALNDALKNLVDSKNNFIASRNIYEQNLNETRKKYENALLKKINGIPNNAVFGAIKKQRENLEALREEQQALLILPDNDNHMKNECRQINRHLDQANIRLPGKVFSNYLEAHKRHGNDALISGPDSLNCDLDESIGRTCRRVFASIDDVTSQRKNLATSISNQAKTWPQMISKSTAKVADLNKKQGQELGGCW